MESSIKRFPENFAITQLAVMTKGVEYGFIAAGITVAAVAAFQSLTIIVSWLVLGG